MKACPRCGAFTFDDMEVCFGCMYHFKEDDRTGTQLHVRVQEEGHEHRLYRLPMSFPLSIGRGLGNDIHLDSARVSRSHACITLLDDGSVQLDDLCSRNGIRKDGQRLPARSILHVGDSFQIGDATLSIE